MAAAVSGSQKRPIKPSSCLPSCFNPSSVSDRNKSTPAPPDHSPPGTKGEKRLPEKLCKAQKRNKVTTKILSTQSHDSSHNRFCKHSSNLGSYLIEHVHYPVENQTRTGHLGSPELTRNAGSTQTHVRFDTFAGLIIVTVMLMMIFSFGRIFAFFCFCIFFGFFSFRKSLSEEVKVDKKEVNMDSEEYKKKVVLMGLLQRKKAWLKLTPVERRGS